MNKKIIFFLILPVVIAVIIFTIISSKPKANSSELAKEIKPTIGMIENIVSTTGTVLPKNRLEIKPPVGGRIESILVKEGDDVKAGQAIGWMSSTERAALLDAARGQGTDKLKYWEEVYKPIELLAPIDGEVIVATTQPGQTVTTNDAVVVLSDRLIIRAQVDETDIGKIKLAQKAVVSLDAYADIKVNAVVEHIYYESKTVNNVTIYEVDLLPEEVLEFFRSGMNTTINFITESRKDALIIPLEALNKDKEGDFVFIKKNSDKEPLKQVVELGISDDKNVDVVSGLNAADKIIVKIKKFNMQKPKTATSPFTPFGSRRRQN